MVTFMQTFSKSQFKARALEIMRVVEATGESIRITDHGRVVLELKPATDAVAEDALAQLRGSVLQYDSPFEPVGEDLWEAAG